MSNVNLDELKNAIETKIPGSYAIISNERKDGEHFEIKVAWIGFKKMSLIEQHKMVHDAIGEHRSKMHGIVIKTQSMIVNNQFEEDLFEKKVLPKNNEEEVHDVKEMIRKTIAHNDVAMFVKGNRKQPLCGFSAKVMAIFTELKVDYKEVNIFDDISIRHKLAEMTGWPTIPQVFIKGKLIGGADITEEMYLSGDLQKMLKEANLIA